MLRLIGRLLYRLFVVAFFVALEIAVYMTVEVAYLRPARDVYLLHCGENGSMGTIESCAPFRPAVLGLTIIQVVVGLTVLLGAYGVVKIFISHGKSRKGKTAKKAELEAPAEVKTEPAPDPEA